MQTIGGLSDAVKYWRSNNGGTVAANEKLIKEIKGSLSKVFNELEKIVKKKIADAEKNKTYHIQSEPGSRRAGWCLTLGSFSVDIEYDYKFAPKQTNHNITYHFSGYDTWDFELKKSQWYDIPTHLRNLFEEIIPNMIAGKGTPFDVTYDFYETKTITTNKTA